MLRAAWSLMPASLWRIVGRRDDQGVRTAQCRRPRELSCAHYARLPRRSKPNARARLSPLLGHVSNAGNPAGKFFDLAAQGFEKARQIVEALRVINRAPPLRSRTLTRAPTRLTTSSLTASRSKFRHRCDAAQDATTGRRASSRNAIKSRAAGRSAAGRA